MAGKRKTNKQTDEQKTRAHKSLLAHFRCPAVRHATQNCRFLFLPGPSAQSFYTKGKKKCTER